MGRKVRTLPLLARVGEQAAAATDASIVEQQMDLVRHLLFGELVAEALEMILDRHVGDMRRDAQALRQLLDLAESLGLSHRGFRDVAHRDIAALGNELPGEFPPHARAATGDDGDLSSKFLHGTSAPPLIGMFLSSVRAPIGPRAKCSSASSTRKSGSARRRRSTFLISTRGVFVRRLRGRAQSQDVFYNTISLGAHRSPPAPAARCEPAAVTLPPQVIGPSGSP
jgi:hypothetical protein